MYMYLYNYNNKLYIKLTYGTAILYNGYALKDVNNKTILIMKILRHPSWLADIMCHSFSID